MASSRNNWHQIDDGRDKKENDDGVMYDIYGMYMEGVCKTYGRHFPLRFEF